jgi:hypothetical protein
MHEKAIDKAGEYASWGDRDWLADDEGSHGALPPKEPGHPHEVYFRPPENDMDPETLLRVLRKRLG